MTGDREEAAKVLLEAGWGLDRVTTLLRPRFEVMPSDSVTFTAPSVNFGSLYKGEDGSWQPYQAPNDKTWMKKRVDDYANGVIRSNQQQQVDEDLTRKQSPWQSKR